MKNQNYEEMTIESNVFEQARQNFDLLLQNLFQKMEQNNSKEGSIVLKVDINMMEDFVPDENGDSQRISKPLIKHKVTTTVPVKDSFDGKKDTWMELVYDDELKRYVLKYVSAGGQRSIFDEDFPDIINGEARVVDDEKESAGIGEHFALPGTVDEETENSDSSEEDSSGEETWEDREENGACGVTEAYEGDEDDYEYED